MVDAALDGGTGARRRRAPRAGDRAPARTGARAAMDRPLGPVGVPAPLVARDVSHARARARAATVIRHRPGGRGHAYLVDLDQRVPVQPVAGTTLELRVTTSISCESVHLELQRGGSTLALAAAEFQPPAFEAVGEGHLAASASAQPPAGRRPWRVVL